MMTATQGKKAEMTFSKSKELTKKQVGLTHALKATLVSDFSGTCPIKSM